MTATRVELKDLHSEFSDRIIVENIKKYLEAYDDEWIVIHVALQNAMDAIQRSERPGGKITIDIWPEDERVKIHDNGRGFRPELELLAPGISDKTESGDTKGYQGVGLKALMYSTNSFRIDSVYEPKKRWIFQANDMMVYLDGGVPDITQEHLEVDVELERETSVEYSFTRPLVTRFINDLLGDYMPTSGKGSDPRWFDLFRHIEDPTRRLRAQIEYVFSWYFRTFTYAGDCNKLLNVDVRPDRKSGATTRVKPIEITIEVHRGVDLGKAHSSVREFFAGTKEDRLTVKFVNSQWDFEETVQYLKGQEKRFSSTAPDIERFSLANDEWLQNYARYKDKLYVRKLVPDHTKSDFSQKYAEYLSLLKVRRSGAVDWQTKYHSLFDKVLGIYIVIGRTSLFERFGILNRGERFIAANGIPTTHELSIRSTSNTWYLETIHFVINVDERLNYGKKQIANTRLIGKVREYFEDAYTKLMQVSKAFVREDERRDEETNDIVTEFISLEPISLPGINIVKVPHDENSLIALFFQLLNSKDLLGHLQVERIDLEVYGLLGKGIYDGRFRWDGSQKPTADDHLKRLEFKISLKKLLDDFESSTNAKRFDRTDLIVVWKDDLDRDEMSWKVRHVNDDFRRKLDRKGVPSYIEWVLEEDNSMEIQPLVIVSDWVENAVKYRGHDSTESRIRSNE